MTEVLNKNTKKFLVEMSKKELKYYPTLLYKPLQKKRKTVNILNF